MEPLPVTESPGLESFDPRFMEVSSMAQDANYSGAASLAGEILEEGIFDIRVIGFYLYGCFAERGPGAIAVIFRCLSSLLTRNWEAVGPVEKREKHAQSSLNWLVKTLVKKLQYEENAKGHTWEEWIGNTSADEVGEALEATGDLQRSLGMALGESSATVIDGLTKVATWLRGFHQLVYRESEPEAEGEGEPGGEEAGGEAAGGPAPERRGRAAGMEQNGGGGTLVEGSYHLGLLMKKLEVFDRLITEEKFPRAAIVASDINAILSSFDPKLYFPKLFSRYSYLFAVNISELAQYDEQKESAEWQAMEEYYKVDIDGFAEF
jgi:hypothetical protein